MKNKFYNEQDYAKICMYNTELEYAIGIDFDSHEGNIFNIVGKASVVLRQVDKDAERKIKEMRKRVTASRNYLESVKIVREYINVLHVPISE